MKKKLLFILWVDIRQKYCNILMADHFFKVHLFWLFLACIAYPNYKISWQKIEPYEKKCNSYIISQYTPKILWYTATRAFFQWAPLLAVISMQHYPCTYSFTAKITLHGREMYPLYNAPINTKYTVMYCNYSIILKSTPSGCIQHAKPLLTPKFQSYDYITWKENVFFMLYANIHQLYCHILQTEILFYSAPLLATFSS